MTAQTSIPQKRPAFGLAIALVFVLYAGWTLAWLLSLSLQASGALHDTPLVHFLYWTLMRLLLWVLPPALFLRRMGIPLRDVFSLQGWKNTLLWGGGAGLAAGFFTLLFRLITAQPLFSVAWGWPLVTSVILAPVVEELFFRGAVMKALETRLPFFAANLLTGLLFLLAHFPGWYFQGRLQNMLLSPAGGALGVFVLGLVFGYVAKKSGSLPAAILAHMLNNFFSA